MSILLMAQVWDLDLPAADKLTLMALADWANDDGTSIYPSQKTLARKASQSERTIRRQLSRFESHGVLERAGTRGATGRVVEWRLNPANLAALVNDPIGRGNPANGDTQSGQAVADRTISEPSVTEDEPQTTSSVHRAERVAIAQRRDLRAPKPVEVVLDERVTVIPTAMEECVWLFGKPDSSESGGTWARYQKLVNLASGHPPGEITRRWRLHSAGLGYAATLGSLTKRWDELGGVAAAVNTLPLAERQRRLAAEDRADWFRRKAAEAGEVAR